MKIPRTPLDLYLILIISVGSLSRFSACSRVMEGCGNSFVLFFSEDVVEYRECNRFRPF